MVTLLPTWLAKSSPAFRCLADRPVTLFLLLLAINALARPYSNCAHDARIYSLQVLNQAEGGAFADDVFLRYGSQDKFSIFSAVTGPVAALADVRPTFFISYLVFNTYFIWGLFRVTRALIGASNVSTVALIYLVSADLLYGGHGIFTVHEQFFTPRLVATGFVLHALERLLAHRFAASVLLLAPAMVLHPLMAFGGLLMWIGYVAQLVLSPRAFFAGLVGVGMVGASLLLFHPAGLRLFGEMDDEWHDMVRLAVLYNYPDAWSMIDWVNQLLALGLCAGGFVWLFRADPVRGRFLFIATLVGVVGLATHIVASMSPYALLFQGQPYRAVWILKVLQIPLAFLVLARWSESHALLPRLGALALAGYFLIISFATNEMLMFLFVLPLAVFYWWWMEDPVRSDWWWHAGATTLCGGEVSWMLYRWGFMYAHREVILGYYDQSELFRVFIQCVPAVLWMVLALVAVRWMGAQGQATALRWTCGLFALAIPALHFAMDATPQSRSRFTRYGADMDFVRQTIEAWGQVGERVPAVYCSLGRVDYIWLDLHATSYYDAVQTAGVMFNRKTAVELRRRIERIRNFEMDRLRTEAVFLTDDAKAVLERLYGANFEGSPPSEADLVRLCQEPGLDFVVVPQKFPGLYSATNGRIYVYECYKVRTASSFSARVAPRGR
ncbi:MAG: hypothetical protein EXR98_13045 [Gemmataceae bacterium]|nr:hypothetical protein [Gemmataceae bacterium]